MSTLVPLRHRHGRSYLLGWQLDDSLSIRVEHVLLTTQEHTLKDDLNDLHSLAITSKEREGD